MYVVGAGKTKKKLYQADEKQFPKKGKKVKEKGKFTVRKLD